MSNNMLAALFLLGVAWAVLMLIMAWILNMINAYHYRRGYDVRGNA